MLNGEQPEAFAQEVCEARIDTPCCRNFSSQGGQGRASGSGSWYCAHRSWESVYPRRPACSALLPKGRRAGKGQCGETSCNAPDAKRVHRHNGHRADNTHTLRGVRHDTQPHAVTRVSQQHAVRTHKHADARVTARKVQCLLKRCCCGRVGPSSGRLLDVPALRLSFSRLLGGSQVCPRPWRNGRRFHRHSPRLSLFLFSSPTGRGW